MFLDESREHLQAIHDQTNREDKKQTTEQFNPNPKDTSTSIPHVSSKPQKRLAFIWNISTNDYFYLRK